MYIEDTGDGKYHFLNIYHNRMIGASTNGIVIELDSAGTALENLSVSDNFIIGTASYGILYDPDAAWSELVPRFERNHIESAGYGLYCSDAVNSINARIVGNYLYGATYGIRWTGNGTVVDGNYITTAAGGTNCAYLSGCARFTNNTCTPRATRILSSADVIVANNRFVSCTSNPLSVDTTSHGARVSNNYFNALTGCTAAMWIAGCNYISVSNNDISAASGIIGIVLDGALSSTITGNTITVAGAGGYGIYLLATAEDSVFSGNAIVGNDTAVGILSNPAASTSGMVVSGSTFRNCTYAVENTSVTAADILLVGNIFTSMATGDYNGAGISAANNISR
jgi:hypothetical protein